MEQTQRGEKDREHEKEVMEGEPARKGDAGAQAATTTKDKGVEPAKDSKRGQKQS